MFCVIILVLFVIYHRIYCIGMLIIIISASSNVLVANCLQCLECVLIIIHDADGVGLSRPFVCLFFIMIYQKNQCS